MIYPSLDELLKHVDSRYTLVTAAAKRARKILEEEKSEQADDSVKAVSIAMSDIQKGIVKVERTKTGIK